MDKSKRIALLALVMMVAGFMVAFIATKTTVYIGLVLMSVGAGLSIRNYWTDSNNSNSNK